jgi:hypothetical protein
LKKFDDYYPHLNARALKLNSLKKSSHGDEVVDKYGEIKDNVIY